MIRFCVMPLLALILQAGDLSGTWTGQVPTRNGETQDVVFKLKQDGNTLRGKLYGDNGDLEIIEGSVAGDTLQFVIKTDGYSGATRFVYQGTLKNGELHLSRETENPETRANAEARKKSHQEVVLKKMT